MTTNLNGVGRAVHGLSIGSYKALERRRQMFSYDALQELDLQYQIPLSGTVTPDGSPFGTEVAFEVDFFNAPEQRDSPLTMPHFTYGMVVTSLELTDGEPLATNAGVVAEACVAGWLYHDTSGAYIGAFIVGSCRAPTGETYSATFEGLLHVNFQGYGAISENETLDIGGNS